MSDLLLLIPMIVVGVIGSIIAGSIEDYVTAQVQNIPNKITDCDSVHPDWKEVCENQKITYNKGITIVNLVGFFTGFGITGGIIQGLKN